MLSLKSITAKLLPRPKSVQRTNGFCNFHSEPVCHLNIENAQLSQAVDRWMIDLGNLFTHKTDPSSASKSQLTISITHEPKIISQGYRITISPDQVKLIGGDSAGCYYGLQTLLQMVRSANQPAKTDTTTRISLPCGIIEDQPDYPTRGLLYDITRGKVPTLDTLKSLVDRLAYLKINQLQLYMEHAFVFSFDPDICSSNDGITADEVHELDKYCHDRFMDLVPSLATFGHMGRILSMPKYRHLAEIEATQDWSEMNWPQKMRGFTLDCMNPESFQLINMMWTEILEAFSSPVVNICGDEPWDLGQGKNKKNITDANRGEIYLDQIRRTHEICASQGRHTQFWSDVILDDPNVFDMIPNESTVLHWGYDDQSNYAATRKFVDHGFDTFVCPSTTGFKRIINAINLAERNITLFARSGLQYGATGLINTDWGDHGHFNMQACSMHGIALGAAAGWRVDHPTGDEFDRALMNCIFDVDDPTLMTHLRNVTDLTNGNETWRWLYQTTHDVAENSQHLSQDQTEQLKQAAYSARNYSHQLAIHSQSNTIDLNELTLALRFTELLADKLKFQHSDIATASTDKKQWAEEMIEASRAYADLWYTRNKPSGIKDIINVLQGCHS